MSFSDLESENGTGEMLWVKHDNKTGKGFFCGEDDISDTRFVADFGNAKIGWGMYDRKAKTYHKEWQENISTPVENANALIDQGYTRAFSVHLYSTKLGLKLWERDSKMEWQGFLSVAKAYEMDANNRGDQLAVIGYEGAETVETDFGVFYKPIFKILDWVDRPSDFVVADDEVADEEEAKTDMLGEDDLPF